MLAGVFTVFAFGFSALSYVDSYEKSIQPSSFRSFSVTGEGKVVAVPDIATFDFQVINEGDTNLNALQKANTETANKVIAFVKSNGVADKDIKTESYYVTPRYETCSYAYSSSRICPPAKIVGYTISQSVSVKMRDFTKVGDIVGGVVTNGANQVGSLSFTIDDQTAFQTKARAEAMTKAKAKAEEMARAGGFKLGRLLGIQEGGTYYPIYRSFDAKEAMPSAAGMAPSIEAGSQDVTVSVTMQYEIQ